MVKFVMHVATDEKGVIEKDGKIPWRIPSDLARFRAHTIGRPVVMGRKTFETLGRPLDRRVNIVLTQHAEKYSNHKDNVIFLPYVESVVAVAEAYAKLLNSDEIAFIGGASVYKRFLPMVDRIYQTVVHTEVGEGLSFPDLHESAWSNTLVKSNRDGFETGGQDEFATTYVIHDRTGMG